MIWVNYDENNSGGGRWLCDDDHRNLIRAGWIVYNGHYTCTAYKQFPSLDAAIAEWESITGQDANEEGCSCCGQPHNFYAYDVGDTPDFDYLNGPGNRYSSRVYDLVDTTGSVVDRKALPA